jgi:hypothetical protein
LTSFVFSYGPGEEGIERLDLLVGDMYEGKVQPSFALSETSFIIFLLMASRRLDADPFLNELYTEEYYGKFGLSHVKKNEGLFDLLNRHYPDLAEPFKDKKGNAKQSAFKPTLGPKEWEDAIANEVVPKEISDVWATTKKENDKYFDDLEAETKVYTKNLKANSIFAFKAEWTYIVICILLVIVPLYLAQTTVNEELVIKPLFPINIAREFAFSNVRHNDYLNRVSLLNVFLFYQAPLLSVCF